MSRRAQKHEEYRTPPDLMIACMMRVLSTLPGDRKASAIRVMAEHLKVAHFGLPVPEWIDMFAALADSEPEPDPRPD